MTSLMLCVPSIVFLWVLSNFGPDSVNQKLCLRGYTGSGLTGEENPGIDGKSIDGATCIYETSALTYERIRGEDSLGDLM